MCRPWHLYVITNLINGKQYVGVTTNPVKRRCKHYSGWGSKIVGYALRKYGKENLQFLVCFHGRERIIKDMEQNLITALKTKVPNGYNLTGGGDGKVGHFPSEETRKKISEACKGRGMSIETRKKISETHKGMSYSIEARKKMSETSKGIWHSIETREKMSEARKGSKHYRAKKVFAGGVEYGCVKDAAEATGINYSTLQQRFRKWNRAGNFPAGFGYVTDLIVGCAS